MRRGGSRHRARDMSVSRKEGRHDRNKVAPRQSFLSPLISKIKGAFCFAPEKEEFFMKRVLSLLTLAALLVLGASFAGCAEERPLIGILRFGPHASLTHCYDGVIAGLEEGGVDLSAYEILSLDSNFDTNVAQSQAKSLVNRGAKVVIAIATPAALAAANAAAERDVPVVYCAVTDTAVMANYENVTGSSDIPDFAGQLTLITRFLEKEEITVGVLRSAEESGSAFQVAALRDAAGAYGGRVKIVDTLVSDITTIDARLTSLIEGERVDCLLNLLDNTIVGKLSSHILPAANAAGIPVFGSEIEQVKAGCVASATLDYREVGRLAGISASAVLRGVPAGELPVRTVTNASYTYNAAACRALGLTVPGDLPLLPADEEGAA